MKGWVYVFSNKAMPDLVKVGYSNKEPELRAKELKHTGTPHPYLVDYELLIEDPYQIEQKTHKLLSEYWEGKEWYRCSAEVAIAAIKQVAGTQEYTEKYKRAKRAEAEEILQKQFADQEKKRTEKKKADDIETLLLVEETKIKETYKQKFEQQFPLRLFRIYWGWGTVLVFIAFILFKDASWVIFFVSIFLGSIAGIFLQNYFEKEQKKSTQYLSLTSKREEELAGVRVRNATCQKCATNIRFERKIVLLANPDAIWSCPNCKESITSPYSPNKSKPIETDLSTPSKVIPTLIESVPQQKSENFWWVIFIAGMIVFIWLLSTVSDNSAPSNPTVVNSVPLPAPVTAPAIPFSNQSNITTQKSASIPVIIHQKTPNIPERENKHAKPQKKNNTASDFRHCLSLQTNEAIAGCVEK